MRDNLIFLAVVVAMLIAAWNVIPDNTNQYNSQVMAITEGGAR
jgi:hypothetical protein